MMNLREIALQDLKALISVCDAVAQTGNRFFKDLFVLLSKEALQRHESNEMANYTTVELCEAVEHLKAVLDEAAAAGVLESYPALMFVRLTLAAAIAEVESRAKEMTVH